MSITVTIIFLMIIIIIYVIGFMAIIPKGVVEEVLVYTIIKTNVNSTGVALVKNFDNEYEIHHHENDKSYYTILYRTSDNYLVSEKIDDGELKHTEIGQPKHIVLNRNRLFNYPVDEIKYNNL